MASTMARYVDISYLTLLLYRLTSHKDDASLEDMPAYTNTVQLFAYHFTQNLSLGRSEIDLKDMFSFP